MPQVVESVKRLEELSPQMEQIFREEVLPVFNSCLAAKGLRLFDYLAEVLDKRTSKRVIDLIAQANKEGSNECLTDEALEGVIRLTGFG